MCSLIRLKKARKDSRRVEASRELWEEARDTLCLEKETDILFLSIPGSARLGFVIRIQ
jgi:hypothetical protein